MPTKIYAAPTYTAVRSETGAIAVDSATINDANYPQSKAVQPPAGAEAISVYWLAGGGTVLGEDWLDLQILYRDAKLASGARWVEGPTRRGVRQHQEVRFPTRGNNQCYIRVTKVNCAGGTTLGVQAAVAE